MIVRSLGAEESVDPDLADHELLPGDVLMMCSDGLSHFVHDNVLTEKLAANSSPELACDDLIQAAKTGASNDNITCLVLSATIPRGQSECWEDSGRGIRKPASPCEATVAI